MDDDLDFHAGKVASHFQSQARDFAARRRALTVISIIGLVVAGTAILAEHRFWLLKLTGQRSTARISDREERVIGWISSRRMAWQEFPLIETDFQFTFTDNAGIERQGSFTLPEASDAFQVGDRLGVMYPRAGSGTGQPSDWAFYFRHDSVWLSLTSVGLVFLLLAAVCLLWRRQLPSSSAR